MAPPVTLNYIAIVVAIIVSMVIGALWYAPHPMGRRWMTLVGKTPEQLGAAKMGYVLAIFAAAVTAIVLSFIIDYAQATTIAEGALVGVLVWVGFVATAMSVHDYFAGSPMELTVINAAHQLVTLVAMAAVIAYSP